MEAKTMKALVCTGVGEMEMQTRPIPVPGEGEVLIRVRHVGICGSDLHFYRHGFPGRDYFPKILGHECAGDVEAVGDGVEGFRPGDRVCIEPGVPCGACEFCRAGRYNLCERMRFLSAFGENGCMCEYIAFPARRCFHLPDGASTLEGALAEPFAVGLHAVARSGIEPGAQAAVCGAGCIGLMTLMALRLRGVERVYVSDVHPARLQKAAELGAALDPSQGFASLIERATGGRGVDAAFDCTGSEECICSLPALAKRGGKAVIVGNLGRVGWFDYYNFYEKELTVLGVFRYKDMFPRALQAIADGSVRLSSVVTSVRTLDEGPEAFRELARGADGGIKTVLTVP